MLGYKKIDGEYCDIVFDDKKYKPLDELPVYHRDFIAQRDYIDLEDRGYDKSQEALLFERMGARQRAIEVMVTLNGSLLSVNLLPFVNKKTYFAKPFSRNEETIAIACLDGYEKFPFIKIEGSKVRVAQPPHFKGRYLGDQKEKVNHGRSFNLGPDKVLSFERGNLQVFVRCSNMPLPLRSDKFISLREDHKKTIGKVFGALMSVLLLLLLVDTTKREVPKKKISVIYRTKLAPKLPPEVKVAPQPTPTTPQKTTQSPNKVPRQTKSSKAKSSPAKKRLAKDKKVKKSPAPAKRVAPVKKSKAPPPRKAPIKTYSFSRSGKLKNLFEAARSAQNKGRELYKNTTSLNTKTSSPSLSRKFSDRKLADSGKSRKLDMGVKGKYHLDTGSKGLSSKRGVSSMATQVLPRVMKGSIDPELLRRLLQQYMPQFKHCYQRELVRNSKAKGVVDVMFRISTGGSISNVRVGKKKGQVFTKKGAGCLGQVLSLIDFPSPKGGGVVDVKQPLNFVSYK